MSINQVMILNPFILLPDEQISYETPTTRTLFTLSESNTQGRQIQLVGKLYVTNKRLVVISVEGDYKSLNILLPQIKSYKLCGDGWFKQMIVGANKFEIILLTNADQDIGLQKLKLYKLIIQFNDGGIWEFVNCFEKLYTGILNDQPIEDQLPAYSE